MGRRSKSTIEKPSFSDQRITLLPSRWRRTRSGIVVPVGNSVIDPFCDELERDELYQRELSTLRFAALSHTTPGVDLRTVLPRPVTHEVLLAWQGVSEARLAEERGRRDLIGKRRHYLLRTDDSMPLDPPLISSISLENDREDRIYSLRDEKEYLPISFFRIKHPATNLRPIRAIFRHPHVRALLDWKASNLDSWLSICPQLIGGYIVHDFSNDVRAVLDRRAANQRRGMSKPRSHTNEVKFDAWLFWLWYVSQMN